MSDWATQTLQYYAENQEQFFDSTVYVDMSLAQNRFLARIPDKGRILDFGCGSGRDAKRFSELGYLVDATDGSEELCRKAAEYTGLPVKQMMFQDLAAVSEYDGIWACSSILHLPKAELKQVLQKIAIALKAGGVLYTSFKYGTLEGMRNGRYFSDFTEETLEEFWRDLKELTLADTWVTKDVRPGRGEEKWINLLAVKEGVRKL